MTDVFREIELEVSADLVRQCPGLSMDVGGSVAKIVYRSKDEWERLQKDKDAKSGKLRLLSCARTLLDEAILKIKAQGYITPNGDKATEIYTCGIGCSQFGASINRELNVNLSNIIEMDCFVKAFYYLVERYSPAALLKPPCMEQIDSVHKEMEVQIKLFKKFQESTSWKFCDEPDKVAAKDEEEPDPYDFMKSELPLAKALDENMYPCMLAMLGSAFAFMQINADGSFQIHDGSNRGGRTMLGLGCLLTRAKTYDEIIDLAEKGNRFNLDVSNKAFAKETEAPKEDESNVQDVYKDMIDAGDMTEQVVFSFGHGVGKTIDDFKKEDLADAVVHLNMLDTVASIGACAAQFNIKNVFVSGSYAARDYVRELFTIEWERRAYGAKVMAGKDLAKLHFMTAGSHLGALGALINNVEHFISRDGTVGKTDSAQAEK